MDYFNQRGTHMTFYFAWGKEEDVFNPLYHRRQDEDLFHLVIDEQEGGFPLAHLKIRNPQKGLGHNPDQQVAFISYEKSNGELVLLFKGRLCTCPEQIDGETIKVQMTAEPSNSQEQLELLHAHLKKSDFWDPLFLSREARQDPRESLEARDCLFYWSRLDQSLSLTNIFKGRSHVEIGTRFIQDSLDIRLTDLPLAGVEIRLKASWRQSWHGRTDITYPIRSRFPGGLVNSFTGEDLERRWWREGEKIGRSGYWVEESRLQEIPAPYTGVLGVYPRQSEPLWVSPQDPSARGYHEPFQTRLKRHWYRSRLILGWRYRQKRTETVRVFLPHRVQPLGAHLSKVRTLSLYIHGIHLADEYDNWFPNTYYIKGGHVVINQKVYRALQTHRSKEIFHQDQNLWHFLGDCPDIPCEKGRSSFFTSPRGHQCVVHALDMARAHLAASSRAVEVSFSTDFESAINLTCDHSLTLIDDRLPGGQVMGKIKSLRFVADGSKGIFRADLKIAAAVGVMNDEESPQEEGDRYVEDAYAAQINEPTKRYLSAGGIAFKCFYD